MRGGDRQEHSWGGLCIFLQIGRAIECGRYLYEWHGQENLAKIGSETEGIKGLGH